MVREKKKGPRCNKGNNVLWLCLSNILITKFDKGLVLCDVRPVVDDSETRKIYKTANVENSLLILFENPWEHR